MVKNTDKEEQILSIKQAEEIIKFTVEMNGTIYSRNEASAGRESQ